ncbi:hypothetical protein [Azospirillum tabaci]|uniref:hypothetical protein n=1 Tax=Azospirillum tabaci TaxID=2752310 RepID=UPI0016607E25|nr:hypothetical protein [Azospirillum tabaci]
MQTQHDNEKADTTVRVLAAMSNLITERGWVAPTVEDEAFGRLRWWGCPSAPFTLHGAFEVAMRQVFTDALPISAFGQQNALECLSVAAGEPVAGWEAVPKREQWEVLRLLDLAGAVARGASMPGVPVASHSISLAWVKQRLDIDHINGGVTLGGASIGTCKFSRQQIFKDGMSRAISNYEVDVVVEGKNINVATQDYASLRHWMAVRITGVLRDAAKAAQKAAR